MSVSNVHATSMHINYMSLPESDYIIENIEIDGDLIGFEVDGEECLYDLESETIYISDDTEIDLSTTVELVDYNAGFSEFELLELEKERIKACFIEMSNSGIETCSTTVNPQVPSNASWRVVANYSKDISKVKANAETALNRITLATAVLSKLNGVPYREYLSELSNKLGMALTTVAAFQVSATGVWKYQMHATDNAYPAGNTVQICYRYAHTALNMAITILEGSYQTQIFNINKSQSGVGGWWVNQKPY